MLPDTNISRFPVISALLILEIIVHNNLTKDCLDRARSEEAPRTSLRAGPKVHVFRTDADEAGGC